MQKQLKTVLFTNAVVIAITFLLFITALLTKGITHDILLETAVFLVSVKLILTTVSIKYIATHIDTKLDNIHNLLLKNKKDNN